MLIKLVASSMSRNKEKSGSLLNRYYAQQGPQILTDRPRRVNSIKDISEAEQYRAMCIKEINRDLTRINDAFINEYEIRDLNDKLNALMREKRSWEHQIKYLGGSDYLQMSSLNNDRSSILIKGQRYFGRARELPDIKALIKLKREEENRQKKIKAKVNDKRTVVQKLKQLEFSPTYYGNLGGINHISPILPSEDSIINQISNNVGRESLPDGLVIHSEILELNEDEKNNDPVITFETRRSHELIQNTKSTKSIMTFKEEIGPNLSLDSNIERMIVQKRKQELLKQITGV